LRIAGDGSDRFGVPTTGKKTRPAVRKSDGHKFRPRPDKKTVVQIPKTPKKQAASKKGTRPSTVYEYAAGDGMVRVGKKTIELMKGEVNFDDWTDEELVMGAKARSYNKKGEPQFSRIPQVIPLAVYQELANRVISRAQHKFVAELKYAIDAMMELVKETDTDVVPANVRRQAAEYIIDRVMGKATEHVEAKVTVEAPWEKIMATAIVNDKEQIEQMEQLAIEEQKEEDIVEGELVSE
jgi:hypothetical protein